MTTNDPAIVSADWLKQNLEQVVVLDASFYLPTMNKDADEEFAQAHIPSAQRWDIDKIARTSVSGLPHMMPPAMQIVQEAEKRGINHNTHVVVYDQLGVFSSPRMWFTLKTIGHEKVSVLDGGLPAWINAGFETHSGDAAEAAPKSYVLDAKPGRLATCNLKTMICSLEREDTQIMDARPAARFQGKVAEPRPGLKSGHMPHSISLPFSEFIVDGHFIKPDAIQHVFDRLDLNLDGQLITTCGSGVSAAVINLALYQIGKTALLYDGSWAEWGDPAHDLPVQTQS